MIIVNVEKALSDATIALYVKRREIQRLEKYSEFLASAFAKQCLTVAARNGWDMFSASEHEWILDENLVKSFNDSIFPSGFTAALHCPEDLGYPKLFIHARTN